MLGVWYNIKIGRARPCPSRKNPHSVHLWGSRLGLPSRRVKWSKSTKTLPRTSSVLNFPTMALGCPSMFGTLIVKSRREKQGVEPSYSTIRIPQTFPFRAVARPFLEVLLWVVETMGVEPTWPPFAVRVPSRDTRVSLIRATSFPYLNLVYLLYHIRLSLSSVFQHFFYFFCAVFILCFW